MLLELDRCNGTSQLLSTNIATLLKTECEVLNCTSKTTPEELFLFLAQSPKGHVFDLKSSTKSLSLPNTFIRQTSGESSISEDSSILEPTILQDVDTVQQKQVVLIHQIDRASKRTQAALQEFLIHKQLHLSGKNYIRDTLVVATVSSKTNLRRELLDRFLLCVPVLKKELNSKVEVYTLQEMEVLKKWIPNVFMNAATAQYVRDIIIALRLHPDIIEYPTSPLAADKLILASKALAATQMLNYVTPIHVMGIAFYCLGHCVRTKKEDNGKLLAYILASVKSPV